MQKKRNYDDDNDDIYKVKYRQQNIPLEQLASFIHIFSAMYIVSNNVT